MFKTTSMTGTGILAFFIVSFLHFFGVISMDSQASVIAANLVQIVAFVLMVWGQARRPDIEGFLFKAEK